MTGMQTPIRHRVALAGMALALVACVPASPPQLGRVLLSKASPRATASPRGQSIKPILLPASPAVTPSPAPLQGERPPVPVTGGATPFAIVPTAAAANTVATATPTVAPTATVSPPSVTLETGRAAADTWTNGPPLRRPRYGLVAGVAEGALLAIEGDVSPSMEVYRTSDPVWRLDLAHDGDLHPGAAASTLLLGRHLLAGAVMPGSVCTAGGDDGALVDAVVRYAPDGLVDASLKLAKPVRAAAAGIVGDVMLVVGGLTAGDRPVATVQRLNLVTTEKSEGRPMPFAVAGATSVMFDGRLVVLGGYLAGADGNITVVDRVQIYDPTQDLWRSSADGEPNAPAPLPVVRQAAAAAVLDGKIYLVGGVGTGGGLIPTTSVYDPLANRWQSIAPLPTPRALLALAAFDGRLWAIGGRGGDRQPANTVEIYQP